MIIHYSESDLANISHCLAHQLKPGDVVGFYGELAAGKTTLIREIVRELGYEGNVNSPTFVIEQRYQPVNKLLEEIIHLDLYRLSSEDVTHFDWTIFSDKNKLTLIEWPEKVEKILPVNAKKIVITKTGEKSRKIKISKNFND